jgi:hypothetical protein
MGTTDQRLKSAHERGTDGTDEEQRQISGGVFIPPFRHSAIGADSKQFAIPPKGGFKAIFIRFFIRGIGVIRGRSPLFLVAAE